MKEQRKEITRRQKRPISAEQRFKAIRLLMTEKFGRSHNYVWIRVAGREQEKWSIDDCYSFIDSVLHWSREHFHYPSFYAMKLVDVNVLYKFEKGDSWREAITLGDFARLVHEWYYTIPQQTLLTSIDTWLRDEERDDQSLLPHKILFFDVKQSVS